MSCFSIRAGGRKNLARTWWIFWDMSLIFLSNTHSIFWNKTKSYCQCVGWMCCQKYDKSVTHLLEKQWPNPPTMVRIICGATIVWQMAIGAWPARSPPISCVFHCGTPISYNHDTINNFCGETFGGVWGFSLSPGMALATFVLGSLLNTLLLQRPNWHTESTWCVLSVVWMRKNSSNVYWQFFHYPFSWC